MLDELPRFKRLDEHRHRWRDVVDACLEYRKPDGVSTLFAIALQRARTDAEAADRAEVAARIAAAVERSGLTRARFAELVGTSASLLSTYLRGQVTPSAAMLRHIERAAGLEDKGSATGRSDP